MQVPVAAEAGVVGDVDVPAVDPCALRDVVRPGGRLGGVAGRELAGVALPEGGLGL